MQFIKYIVTPQSRELIVAISNPAYYTIPSMCLNKISIFADTNYLISNSYTLYQSQQCNNIKTNGTSTKSFEKCNTDYLSIL